MTIRCSCAARYLRRFVTGMGFNRPELEVAETSGSGKDSLPLSMGGQLQPSHSSRRRRGPLVVIGGGVVLEGSQMNILDISGRKDADWLVSVAGVAVILSVRSLWSRCRFSTLVLLRSSLVTTLMERSVGLSATSPVQEKLESHAEIIRIC